MVRHRVQQVAEVVCLGSEAEALCSNLVSNIAFELIAQREIAESDVVQSFEPSVIDDCLSPRVVEIVPTTSVYILSVTGSNKLCPSFTTALLTSTYGVHRAVALHHLRSSCYDTIRNHTIVIFKSVET